MQECVLLAENKLVAAGRERVALHGETHSLHTIQLTLAVENHHICGVGGVNVCKGKASVFCQGNLGATCPIGSQRNRYSGRGKMSFHILDRNFKGVPFARHAGIKDQRVSLRLVSGHGDAVPGQGKFQSGGVRHGAPDGLLPREGGVYLGQFQGDAVAHRPLHDDIAKLEFPVRLNLPADAVIAVRAHDHRGGHIQHVRSKAAVRPCRNHL